MPNPSDPEEIVNVLTDMMFPETPTLERKQYFIDTFLFDDGSLLQEGDEKYYYWEFSLVRLPQWKIKHSAQYSRILN